MGRRGVFVVVSAPMFALLVACGGAANSWRGAPPSTDEGADAGMVKGDDRARVGAIASSDGRTAPPAAGRANPNLHVEGNMLVYRGEPTRLLGVDHSGSEYACINGGGYGFFEGPDPDTLARGMTAWGHVNAVRVPLNEDCWLGINGVSAAYGGQAYRRAVTQYAHALHAHGLFTIVDMHWNAPGSFQALGQQPMADADHGPAFWTSVATAFKDDPMTVFDMYNEPYVAASNATTTDPWACWAEGCTITSSNGNVSGPWKSAGMNDLVDAVRVTGATNVLMLGGLAYANDLTGWLAHVPVDPLGQVTASFHLYNFNACADASCWDSQIAPVAARVPVITGELGENDCAHGFVDRYMPWADAHRVSYLGWTWNAWDCASGPALVTGYDGTPTAFGQGMKAHLTAASP